MTENALRAPPIPDPRHTALKLGALFIADLVVFGQGAFSLLTSLIGAPVLAMAAGWSYTRSDRTLAGNRALRASLFVLLGAATYLATGFHARHAERRAEEIIRASVEYESQTGALPTELSDLIPDYLPKLPRAKLTLMYADFTYAARESSHVLTYVAFPPYGRRSYRFEDRTWGTLD